MLMDERGAAEEETTSAARVLRAGVLCGLGSGAALGLGLALLAQHHTANPLLHPTERMTMVVGWMLAWAMACLPGALIIAAVQCVV